MEQASLDAAYERDTLTAAGLPGDDQPAAASSAVTPGSTEPLTGNGSVTP